MSHIKRVRFGIPLLDNIVEEGFPRPCNILVLADDLARPDELVQQIIWHRLKQGDYCFYNTVKLTRKEDVLEGMERQGFKVSEYIADGRFIINDFMETSSYPEPEASFMKGRSDVVDHLGKMLYPKLLIESLKKKPSMKPSITVLDNASNLFAILGVRLGLKTSLELLRISSKKNMIAFGIMYRDSVPKIVEKMARVSAEGIIDLKAMEAKSGVIYHYLRVSKMKLTVIKNKGWIPYEGDEGGVIS